MSRARAAPRSVCVGAIEPSEAAPRTAERVAELVFSLTDLILAKLTQGPAVMIDRPPPPAVPKSGHRNDRPCHSKVAGQTHCLQKLERALTTEDYSKPPSNKPKRLFGNNLITAQCVGRATAFPDDINGVRTPISTPSRKDRCDTIVLQGLWRPKCRSSFDASTGSLPSPGARKSADRNRADCIER